MAPPITRSQSVSELTVGDLRDMIKDMLQEDLKALLHRELEVVVREELGDRLDRMEQQLAKVSDLQVQMAGLESSIQFASKRIDDLYRTSLPALAAHLERVTSALALQTLDIDVHRRKWALTVQGLKGAAKEDESDTRAACVQLAKDNLAIDDASVLEFAACHRLSQKADAGIIVRFCDLSWRNMWLANAKHLRGSANHVSISPDVPPVLRPIKKDLLQKRKDLPPEEKKRSFIRYHRQWPYMDLAVGNNIFVRSDIRKEAIVQSVLGANPMFSVQEPEAWFLIASMKRSIPIFLQDHMRRKTFIRITASILNPIV